jgi:hypothetical protein
MQRAPHTRQVGGDHYYEMGLQPWAVIRRWFSIEEITGYHRGVALSYLGRAGRKGDLLEDIKKAHHHLEELIDILENEDAHDRP